MSKIKAPNHREAECCFHCQHYVPDYEGEGRCKKHATEPPDWMLELMVCDNFERKGSDE